jgi:hypothetical protein
MRRPVGAYFRAEPQNVRYISTSEYSSFLRLYSGRIVPGRADQVEIKYEMDGGGGVIDAWLEDSDRMRVAVRHGPALAKIEE